jgi:hypothetical protein
MTVIVRRFIIRLCIAAAFTFLGHLAWQARQVHRLDARYQQVQRGMEAATVFTTMKVGTVEFLDKRGWPEECEAWWDETPLDEQAESRIRYANLYRAPEYLGTVRWVFTFDKNDLLVGKHRFN